VHIDDNSVDIVKFKRAHCQTGDCYRLCVHFRFPNLCDVQRPTGFG
jgi:hypothetical protein